jgi:hypothetical protein
MGVATRAIDQWVRKVDGRTLPEPRGNGFADFQCPARIEAGGCKDDCVGAESLSCQQRQERPRGSRELADAHVRAGTKSARESHRIRPRNLSHVPKPVGRIPATEETERARSRSRHVGMIDSPEHLQPRDTMLACKRPDKLLLSVLALRAGQMETEKLSFVQLKRRNSERTDRQPFAFDHHRTHRRILAF